MLRRPGPWWSWFALRLAVLGGLVVVAVGLSGDGLRAASDEPWQWGPPDPQLLGVMVLAAVVLGGLLLVLSLLLTTGEERALPRRRSTVRSLLILSVFCGLAVLWDQIRNDRKQAPPNVPTAEPTAPPVPAELPMDRDGGSLLLVGVLVLVVMLAAAARHRHVRSANDTDQLSEPAAMAPDGALGAGLAAAARSLRSTDGAAPRQRVVEAYAAFESALADAGVERGETGTPAGLLERAVNTGAPEGPARQLTELFTLARFADRPITAADVTDAQRALDALLAAR